MVLVDSSIWIDYLGTHTSKVDQKLEGLIRPNNQVVVTGIIFQEVLQGIRNRRSFILTQKLMGRLPFLTPTLRTHEKAAEIFRELSLKRKIASTIDCLIGALAIEHKLSLFTLDADFSVIARYSNLDLLTY